MYLSFISCVFLMNNYCCYVRCR